MIRIPLPVVAPSRRRGSFMIIAVICLVLSTTMIGVLLSLVQKHRRQIATEQAVLQAEWLLQSGISRAVFRLRDDRTYHGETWVVDAADLNGASGAETVIDIQQSTDRPDSRTVLVKTVFGSGPGQTVSRSRQTTIELPQEN